MTNAKVIAAQRTMRRLTGTACLVASGLLRAPEGLAASPVPDALEDLAASDGAPPSANGVRPGIVRGKPLAEAEFLAS